MQGMNIEIDQILTSEEAIEAYTDWNEKRMSKMNETDQNKNSKSLIIQNHDNKCNFEESSSLVVKFRAGTALKFQTGLAHLPSFGGSKLPEEFEELTYDMNLPDFNELPSVKKHKSFNAASINDNLNGKNKRFSVMKIIPNEVKEKGQEIAKTLAKSMFIEGEKKLGGPIFNIPKDFEHSSIEIMVKQEILNCKEYIFSIQACRNSVLDFDDKEETMRVIEKSDFEEIVEIRQKFKNRTVVPQTEQGNESQKEHGEKLVDDLPPVSKRKQVSRTYYISQITNSGNIYIVFIEYDQKTKDLIPDHYKIVAIGEKLVEAEKNKDKNFD